MHARLYRCDWIPSNAARCLPPRNCCKHPMRARGNGCVHWRVVFIVCGDSVVPAVSILPGLSSVLTYTFLLLWHHGTSCRRKLLREETAAMGYRCRFFLASKRRMRASSPCASLCQKRSMVEKSSTAYPCRSAKDSDGYDSRVESPSCLRGVQTVHVTQFLRFFI